jgi:hypothetical protein
MLDEIGRDELVDAVEVAAVEAVVDQPAGDALGVVRPRISFSIQ